MASFGENLKRARANKGLTQTQLGEMIGFKKSAISSWESGTTEPSLDTIRSICSILNVSVEFLIENLDIENNDEQTIEEKRNEFNRLMTEKNGLYFRLAKGASELDVSDDDINFMLEFMKRSKK